MTPVLTRTFPAPPVDRREALRYAGCRTPEPETGTLLDGVIAETEGAFDYRVCWRELPLETDGSVCRFGEAFSVSSGALSAALAGCERALLFAATLGVGPDRLIARYGRSSPARALMLQALGAERVEALCDLFCETYAREAGVALTPRFSPGYGDLPLETQREVFAVLDCPRRLGITLTGSLLTSPSKSVTAFAGIRKKAGTTL